MPFTKKTTAALSSIKLARPTQTIVLGLMHLTKLYTEDIKYKGSNDSFSLKLDIFHDSCRRACLPYTPEAYKLALPTMLKGQAQDYYYSWRRTWEEQGTNPAKAIHQYFEGEEYHRNIEHEWSHTTLQYIIENNPGKNTL
jgi:hypothetical protein